MNKEFFNENKTIKLVFCDRFHQLGIMKEDEEGTHLSKVTFSENVGRELFSILHGGTPEED